ncbi:hypothetical protein L916_13331 [Phytophthora nicotianae]|uniref:Uncharacterized protein n=1 Tax=Phytophthora nicotianae TaxID=4792 RepID=W2ILM6_PHYNI|nr:hypothetical protein L916_13331 [Phytophthora nicotianae]
MVLSEVCADLYHDVYITSKESFSVSSRSTTGIRESMP